MTTGIERLRAAFRPGRSTVVAYVPMLDPLASDARTLDTCRDAGVDVLEIGLPTRDPWLDGPEVRASMVRALDAGADPEAITTRLAEWRRTAADRWSPAIVWFSYPDLPLAAVEAAAAADAIDGLLMLEPWRHPEGHRLPDLLAELALAACAFLPWGPTDADLAVVTRATGYVMVQARPGLTGVEVDAGAPTAGVRRARTLAPDLPVVVGFGVRDAATARRALTSGADGVVVGSACIRAARGGGVEAVRELLDGIVASAAAAASPGGSAA